MDNKVFIYLDWLKWILIENGCDNEGEIEKILKECDSSELE